MFKHANAASAAANLNVTDLSLRESTKNGNMAGRRVCSMMSKIQDFARIQNTLLVRVHIVSSVGRKIGIRGPNEDSKTTASVENNSREAPDNLERSELRELARGRDMERREEIS